MGNGPILERPPRTRHPTPPRAPRLAPRASDLDPALPYAVFLQNTLLLWDAVPRVGTLGIHPEKQTRVLKERRIVAGLEPRPRPQLSFLFRHFSLSLSAFCFQVSSLLAAPFR